MRALLILLVFVLYDAQLAIEEQVPIIVVCHVTCVINWLSRSSREKQDPHIGICGLGGPRYGGRVDLASTRSPY